MRVYKTKSPDDRVLDIVVYTALTLFTVAIVLPVAYLLVSSFVSSKELSDNRGFVLFPTKPVLDAYRMIFNANRDMINGYMISVLRVLTAVPLHTFFCFVCGYALSRPDMPLRRFLAIFFFFGFMFSAGIIPYYIIVRSVGLYNNFLVYIIPSIVSSGSILLFRNNILSIPPSLIEAAEADGANELAKIFRICFPLCKAIVVTIMLFSAVGQWNAWFDTYLFVTDAKLRPVQMVLREILNAASIRFDSDTDMLAMERLFRILPPSRAIQSAAVTMVMLPIMCVYPFLQKYFVKGIIVGAVKG